MKKKAKNEGFRTENFLNYFIDFIIFGFIITAQLESHCESPALVGCDEVKKFF